MLLLFAFFDEGGHVFFFELIVIDAETQLDHSVDSVGEEGGLVKGETGGQEGGFEHQPNEVLGGLVVLDGVEFLLEFDDDGVGRVHFHGLLGSHVRLHGGVSQSLSLHDSLHVCGPSVFGSDQDAGGVFDTVRDDHFVDLVTEDLLDSLAETFELSLLFLELLLLFFGVFDLHTFLGTVSELLSVELLQLLDDVLIDGVDHIDDLIPFLLESLNEGGRLDGLLGLTGDEVDFLLAVLHSGDVLLEGDLVLAGLGSLVSEEFGHLVTVGGVFVDTELQVLGELFVELLVVLVVLGDFGDEFQDLLDEVLFDDLEDLVLLEELSGNVEGEVFGIDDTLDEGEVVGDEFVAIVHDEHSSDVEFDVIFFLLGFEEVEGGSLGDVEDGLELKLTLHRELLHGKVVFPVIGQRLVKGGVLLLGDGFGLAHPDGLALILHFIFISDFFHFFLFLFLGFFFFFVFNFYFFTFLLLGFFLVVSDFLFSGLLHVQLNLEIDEFGVFLNNIFDFLFLDEFKVVRLQLQHDSSTSGHVESVIGGDSEGSSGGRLPTEGVFFLARTGIDHHLVGNQIGGVETHTELSDHTDVGSGLEGLHESLGSGTGDGTEIVDHLLSGHSDTGILDGEGVVGTVGHHSDSERGFLGHLAGFGVSDGFVSDFVQSVGGVGD